jgi:hypothetical protein
MLEWPLIDSPGDEWSASHPGRFTTRKRTPRTHWMGGGGKQNRHLYCVVVPKQLLSLEVVEYLFLIHWAWSMQKSCSSCPGWYNDWSCGHAVYSFQQGPEMFLKPLLLVLGLTQLVSSTISSQAWVRLTTYPYPVSSLTFKRWTFEAVVTRAGWS